MFTSAGEKSRAKRVTRASRLGSTDQPAVSLVGPPSYSYGSPNNALPLVPTIKDTRRSISSALNDRSKTKTKENDTTLGQSSDEDEVASQFSTASSRASRRSRKSLSNNTEASENRRRSLRSADKTRVLPGIDERIQDTDNTYHGPEQISLDYDVTQSSLDKTYELLDERPTKESQYYEHESELDDEVTEIDKLSPELPPSSAFMDSINFLTFLLRKGLGHAKTTIQAVLGSFRTSLHMLSRFILSYLWLLPLFFALGAVVFAWDKQDLIWSKLRFANDQYSFPDTLPTSFDEFAQRLSRLEHSLDRYSASSTETTNSLMRSTERNHNLAHEAASATDNIKHEVDGITQNVLDVQQQLHRLEQSLTVIEGKFDDTLSSIATAAGVRDTSEVDDLRSSLERQKALLAEIMSNNTRENHSPDMSRGAFGWVEGSRSPDYASYLSGARVNPFLTSPTYMHRPVAAVPRLVSRLFGNVGGSRSHPPAMAIHPSNEVGMCWAFPGHTGQVSVKLSHAVFLSEIAIEHVHPDIALDSSTAPKEMEIWAQLAENSLEAATAVEAKQSDLGQQLRQSPGPGFVHLLDVTYNAYDPASPVQYYAVPQEIKRLQIAFKQVLFRVKSNWGNTDYTCVYRVRALGRQRSDMTENVENDETL